MSQSNVGMVRFDNSKKNAKQAALQGRMSKPPRDGKQWERSNVKRQQFDEEGDK